MNRGKLLQIMIENRVLEDNDEENLERYCEAFESLSELMMESLNITTEEMIMMVRSFSNKENHQYFLDMLEDAILLHLDKTSDYDVFFKEVINNKEGIMESISVMYGIWIYHKELTPQIQECLQKMDKELLRYSLDDYGFKYDEDFKKLL